MSKNQAISNAEQKKEQIYNKLQKNTFSDLEYSIFSNILKSTSNSLFERETNIMAKSNQLIDSLHVIKKKQMETTADTQTSHQIFSEFDRRIRGQQSPRKLISRRSPKINPTDFFFQKCLQQIQENCSKTVYNDVKNMITELRKLKRVLIQFQTKQRKYEIKFMGMEKIEEQNLILTKKLKETKKQLKKQSEKIKALEEKNKSIPFQLHMKQQISNIDSSIAVLVKQYIDEKQKKINLKLQQIKQIEDQVEDVLQNQVFEEGCEKCCNFLKKIKASIIQYKAYLVQENSYIDTVYKKYKKFIFKYE